MEATDNRRLLPPAQTPDLPHLMGALRSGNRAYIWRLAGGLRAVTIERRRGLRRQWTYVTAASGINLEEALVKADGLCRNGFAEEPKGPWYAAGEETATSSIDGWVWSGRNAVLLWRRGNVVCTLHEIKPGGRDIHSSTVRTGYSPNLWQAMQAALVAVPVDVVSK